VRRAFRVVNFGALVTAWTHARSWTLRATAHWKDVKQSALKTKGLLGAEFTKTAILVLRTNVTGPVCPTTVSTVCRLCLATKNRLVMFPFFAKWSRAWKDAKLSDKTRTVVVDLASVPLFARFVMHVLKAGHGLMKSMNTDVICVDVWSLKTVKWLHAWKDVNLQDKMKMDVVESANVQFKSALNSNLQWEIDAKG